jgi:hypothetical protein
MRTWPCPSLSLTTSSPPAQPQLHLCITSTAHCFSTTMQSPDPSLLSQISAVASYLVSLLTPSSPAVCSQPHLQNHLCQVGQVRCVLFRALQQLPDSEKEPCLASLHGPVCLCYQHPLSGLLPTPANTLNSGFNSQRCPTLFSSYTTSSLSPKPSQPSQVQFLPFALGVSSAWSLHHPEVHEAVAAFLPAGVT